jgi:hypothetical protein
MPLYTTIQHLLNVLVQIANKVGNKEKYNANSCHYAKSRW